ncbi:flagellar basal body-associated FliL family protein [Clostridium chrysemydis]|uniref:flagellar basal body-associated FliL family protein n=1 Tax=Clostridium chrysemydis TaxID=2665504 RepID=UPI0018833303|nr:flagellar basal body-associated FliL family protein [Clostridium chrysemydis]
MAKKKEEGKQGGGKNKVLLVILALIVLGACSFGGTYLFSKSKTAEKNKPVVQAYFDLGEFMVNLSDKGGHNYLKTKISVGYDSETKDGEQYLKDNTVVLRDACNYYLKSKTSKDFSSSNEKELKKELVETLNKKLSKPIILDAYINDIIVQ